MNRFWEFLIGLAALAGILIAMGLAVEGFTTYRKFNSLFGLLEGCGGCVLLVVSYGTLRWLRKRQRARQPGPQP